MNVFFLHGTGGNPGEAFFPWCRKQLEEKGYTTFAPQSPCIIEPNPKEWIETLRQQYEPKEKTILVGRSSGGNIIHSFLQEPDISVDVAISIAAPFDDLGWPNLKKLFQEPYNFESIKKSARSYHHWYSDDDPFVPLVHGDQFQKQIGGELRIFPEYSHFYNIEFPELIELIEKEAEKA